MKMLNSNLHSVSDSLSDTYTHMYHIYIYEYEYIFIYEYEINIWITLSKKNGKNRPFMARNTITIVLIDGQCYLSVTCSSNSG